MRTHNTQI